MSHMLVMLNDLTEMRTSSHMGGRGTGDLGITGTRCLVQLMTSFSMNKGVLEQNPNMNNHRDPKSSSQGQNMGAKYRFESV